MDEESTAPEGVEPKDPYSPDWLTFYKSNPGYRRSVGSAGVNDGDPAPADLADAPAPDGGDDPDPDGNDPDPDPDNPDGAADPDNPDGGDDDPEEEVEYDLGGGQKVKFKANATAK